LTVLKAFINSGSRISMGDQQPYTVAVITKGAAGQAPKQGSRLRGYVHGKQIILLRLVTVAISSFVLAGFP
jgi:hypothetical protein